MQRSADFRAALRFTLGEVVIAGLSTVGMICFISAFFYTSIANVAFVYGTMPLVTFILSLIFLGARADAVSLGCCVFLAAGVAVMAPWRNSIILISIFGREIFPVPDIDRFMVWENLEGVFTKCIQH